MHPGLGGNWEYELFRGVVSTSLRFINHKIVDIGSPELYIVTESTLVLCVHVLLFPPLAGLRPVSMVSTSPPSPPQLWRSTLDNPLRCSMAFSTANIFCYYCYFVSFAGTYRPSTHFSGIAKLACYFLWMLFMPRGIAVCVCVFQLQLLNGCKATKTNSFYRLLATFFWILIRGFAN